MSISIVCILGRQEAAYQLIEQALDEEAMNLEDDVIVCRLALHPGAYDDDGASQADGIYLLLKRWGV